MSIGYILKPKSFIIVTFLIIIFGNLIIFPQILSDSLISVKFKGDAKIEVGSPYVGMEFHHSFPVPQRISFYYPVANSIDLSTDYWKRDTTFISSLNLKSTTVYFRKSGKNLFCWK